MWAFEVHFDECWKSIWLEMRLHEHITHIQRHMNNAWSEIVSYSTCFAFYCFSSFPLFLGSCKQYGIILIPLIPSLCPYSNLIVSHASSITFLFTTSNPMLYLLHLLVLHFYDYKQSNVPPPKSPPTSWWSSLILCPRGWYNPFQV